MQLSARNTLSGRVKQVNVGAVNSEVVIDLGGGTEIVSIITNASAEEDPYEDEPYVPADHPPVFEDEDDVDYDEEFDSGVSDDQKDDKKTSDPGSDDKR